MEIKVLGPLEAWQYGVSIAPTASKHRKVLSLLAMCSGELVTVSSLIEEVWGPDAPRTAMQTLHTYIMRLRQRIDEVLPAGDPPAAKELLITRPCGYTMNIAPEDVDAHHYRELADAGERALESGDHASASRLLDTALRCWRGPALVDVDVGPRLGVEVARLEQSRLSALESRIDADLQLGRHRQLLGELAGLTVRYPMHERLVGQYMTALHFSGQKSHALATFRNLRETLVNELGIEPSHQVRRIQGAILNADTNLNDSLVWHQTFMRRADVADSLRR